MTLIRWLPLLFLIVLAAFFIASPPAIAHDACISAAATAPATSTAPASKPAVSVTNYAAFLDGPDFVMNRLSNYTCDTGRDPAEASFGGVQSVWKIRTDATSDSMPSNYKNYDNMIGERTSANQDGAGDSVAVGKQNCDHSPFDCFT